MGQQRECHTLPVKLWLLSFRQIPAPAARPPSPLAWLTISSKLFQRAESLGGLQDLHMTANVRKNSRHSTKALLRDLTYFPSTLLLFPPGLHYSPHREDHCGNISSAPQRDPPPAPPLPWLLSPACRWILMGSCSLLAPSCTSLWESPAPPASLPLPRTRVLVTSENSLHRKN